MEINTKNAKELICIEYPGRVENIDRMIETLGGKEELSKGLHEKQKLQLQFRKNFYAKPVLSTEPNDVTGMLIKLKVRKSKEDVNKKPEVISAELYGTVSTMYKFNNYADYQFLPIQRNEKTGETENIYNDIVPQDINVGPSWLRERQDVPLFLPPTCFTRSDTMQVVDIRNGTVEDPDEDIRFAATVRTSRASHGISIPFHISDPIPLQPKEASIEMRDKFVTPEEFESLNNLFKERPMWTLASIKAFLRFPPRRLNYALAPISYYYSSGPWRNCFVRFGYDPRTNFDSRFYQLLDYRVRAGASFKGEVKSFRSSGIYNRLKVPAKLETEPFKEDEIEKNFELRKKHAIFTIDTIPPFKARHYQFIDIHIPKIKEMLNEVPLPPPGALCNDKRGWLPIGFMEQCRDILNVIAQANMLKHCNEKNISLEEYKATEAKSETPAGDDEEDGDFDSYGSESHFPDDVDDKEEMVE
ncbi:CLUMA_CG006983, isoform A [Clunio marinus]|uniref:CLUMA_CG006983, isoform A n=1 Tax=Clunio marinus TaxID=568069 RepID=A0A1J1HZB3_9DIPT|nr:CLUMA_CG006983, isoform A [Clunio marinus]